ncbi:MAG TPA: type I 3-dehydroquinate dehydratase [Thermoanaerobaculia bacterium]|nr:type I 3-dehydroquinate dehydratase [Thermoanaerobaculia bacterium]
MPQVAIAVEEGNRLRLLDGSELVTLGPRDLTPRTLKRVPADKRVVVDRSVAPNVEELLARAAQLVQTPALLYVLAPRARTHADAIAVVTALHRLGRRDVLMFAEGVIGMWTRVVAPLLGAPFVFASDDGDVAADGVPTVEQLRVDYGYPELREARELFGIAGDPVYSSLSPRLHNAAFRAIDRPALYVPFHVPHFAEFWSSIVESGALEEAGLPIGALCVVSPHKQIALKATPSRTSIVQKAQSTNFFVREGGEWTADTTDPAGIILALRERGVDPAGHKAAVVGCGGSGRAVAAALEQAGADVTLVNRGFDRGSLAVHLLRLPFMPLAGFPAERFSLVVNATPCGRDGERPFALERLRDDAVVVDLVYGTAPTPLVEHTRGNGQIAIDGKDILITQAMSQFRLMTGQEMPDDVVYQVLGRMRASVVEAQA